MGTNIMSASNKILSEKPSELELQVAQAFVDLEQQSDLKAELRPLQFKSVREVEVNGGKKALAIFVPCPSLIVYRKVQTRLTRELEKKFPDRHVVFLAERRILPKPSRTSRQLQKRPRSRTLTAVHDKLLRTWFSLLRLLVRESDTWLVVTRSTRCCWTPRTPLPSTTSWTPLHNYTPN